MSTVDWEMFDLGALCKCGHEWQGTGQSLRYRSTRQCVECHRAHMKQYNPGYYADHQDKAKAVSRAYYWEHRDHYLAWMTEYRKTPAYREALQRYREKNHLILLTRTRHWRDANRQHLSIYNREYRLANPGVMATRNARRRIRKAHAISTVTNADVKRAFDYWHGCCAVCGRPLKDLFQTHTAAIDHWKPLANGGNHTPDNIVPLCHGQDGCNNEKWKHDPATWLAQKLGKKSGAAKLAEIEIYLTYMKEASHV